MKPETALAYSWLRDIPSLRASFSADSKIESGMDIAVFIQLWYNFGHTLSINLFFDRVGQGALTTFPPKTPPSPEAMAGHVRRRKTMAGGVRLLPFEPNSVHCPRGFAPTTQRVASTPA